MSVYDRSVQFRTWDADSVHQRMAGLASWAAFSARWRARQGLPLLHPLDVQYLTPGDFCNGKGHPLPLEVARRRFREYVEAAIQCGVTARAPVAGRRQAGLVSGELGFVRTTGFVRWLGRHMPEFVYGRADQGAYEARSLLPQRPYGVLVTSSQRAAQGAYWLDGTQIGDDDDDGDDSWIAAWPGSKGW
jgi:hypothetical protein